MTFVRAFRIAVVFVVAVASGCDSDSGSGSGATAEQDSGASKHDDAGVTNHHDSGALTRADAQAADDEDAGGGTSASPDAATDAGTTSGPATYALAVIVFGPDTTTTYVTLQDSLDFKSVDIKKGIEFNGQANIAAYDGKLFISDGDAPTITRYGLNAARELEKEATISFANYGESDVSVDDTVNTFVSPTKAYLAGSDGTQLVWNPKDMSITGDVTIKESQLKIDAKEAANMTLQESSGVARDGRLYRMFFWLDWMTYEFSKEQYLVTFDTDKDKLASVVSETRCPGLGAQAVTDEQGNAYFSNWFYNVAGVLQHDKPSGCALRLPPGTDQLDKDWTLDFTKVTGGHEGAQLSYIQDGRALFAAFHEEEVDIKPDTSPYDIVGPANWETWSVDIATQKGKPVKGIERLGAQQTVFTLDGRAFVFAPNQDFDLTKAYEVLDDGTSRLAFSIHGWSRAFVKLQ